MSMMPATRPFPPRFNFGQLLASVAAGGAPGLPPGAVGSGVLPSPAPAPGPHFTSPAAGGAPPPPMNGGEPVRSATPAGQSNPIALALGDTLTEPMGLDVPPIVMPPPAPPAPSAPPARKGPSKGQIIAGIVGDMFAGALGRPGTFAQTMQRQREMEWEDAREERKQNRPQFENVPGVGLVAVNPGDMSARTIMAAKSPAQVHAESMGYQPGTDEYNSAIADYALKGWGPTAYGYKSELQDDQQESMVDRLMRTLGVRRDIAELMARTSTANNIRTTSTSAANNQRTTSTSAANNQRTTGQSNINSVRQAETTRGSAAYQGRGGRGAGAVARAVHPVTGQEIVVKNGRWVDKRTGKPVQ